MSRNHYKKEKRETKDRIFIALLIAVMMTALPEIVYAVIKAGSGFNMIYSICETWLMTFIEHVSCMFMAVWLFFLAGHGKSFRKSGNKSADRTLSCCKALIKYRDDEKGYKPRPGIKTVRRLYK